MTALIVVGHCHIGFAFVEDRLTIFDDEKIYYEIGDVVNFRVGEIILFF